SHRPRPPGRRERSIRPGLGAALPPGVARGVRRDLTPILRARMSDSLRSLYVCYLSLEDPLVETQVVAYLEGLAGRGHTIHLLTFEPKLDAARRRRLAADLARRGIAWHSLRYHKRPSLPATISDALVGAFVAARLVRR